MGLMKCPECGKSVSNLAEKCIHCGYPLQRTSLKSYKVIKEKKDIKREKEEEERQKKLRSIQSSMIRCPYCGSIDVKPLGFFDGGWSAVGNNWKCKNCKSYF